MHYRFYLVDGGDRFQAAEAFSAPDDAQAAAIAGFCHQACSDVFDGFELWRGTDRVAKYSIALAGAAAAGPAFAEVVRGHQQTILELEDRLQSTFACIRHSKKLLEVTAGLRAGTDSPV